jgi:1-acyl-sn-glycerol-3-phosphate acyltransferase
VSAAFPRTWRQAAVLAPFARGLRLWHRPRVHGLELVPRGRPLVYVAKHPQGWLYFETILFALLTFWDGDRALAPIRAMEKRNTSVHRLPVTSWIRRHVGAIEASEEAALAALAAGESVLLFPGGARELYGPPDVLDWSGRRGFARIAAKARVPVVPFAIAGADQQHRFRVALGRRGSLWLPPVPLPVRLDYLFAAPMTPPAADDAPALARFADAVAAETQGLLNRGLAARNGRSSRGS